MVQFDEILFDMGTKIHVQNVTCYFLNPTLVLGTAKHLKRLNKGKVVESKDIDSKVLQVSLEDYSNVFWLQDGTMIYVENEQFYLPQPAPVIGKFGEMDKLKVFYSTRSIWE